jgi:hypothetical protein
MSTSRLDGAAFFMTTQQVDGASEDTSLDGRLVMPDVEVEEEVEGTPAEAPETPEETPETSPPPYELPQEAVYTPPERPTGAITDQERIRLEYYERQSQENAIANSSRSLDEYQKQAYDYYLNTEGLDTDTASRLANAHRSERSNSMDREIQITNTQRAKEGVQTAAVEVARRFNVSPAMLTSFTRKEDMERYAQLASYMAQQDKRISAVEQSRVPEQQFAGNGATAGPGSADQILAALGRGDIEPESLTPQQKDILKNDGRLT